MFKPMLSAKLENESKLKFPLYGSPKYDGIRAMVIDGVLVSRNMKPIPNEHTQAMFGRSSLNGLDGELIVGESCGNEVFRRTDSGVMTRSGEPKVRFYVFDDFTNPGDPFDQRYDRVQNRVSRFGGRGLLQVPQIILTNLDGVLQLEKDFLGQGYEGLMLRSGAAPYKYGRGTLVKQDLMKLKRFKDAEAVVIGTIELQQNTNEAKRNALGHLERSSHKAGKVGKGQLGALTVRGVNGPYRQIEFEVGTGFTEAQRVELWRRRHELVGALVKYKYFPTGADTKPRFPVFLGWRNDK